MSQSSAHASSRRLRWSNWVAFALLFYLSSTTKGIPLLEPLKNAAFDATVDRAQGTGSGQTSIVLIRAKDSMFGYPVRPDRLLDLVLAVDSAGAEVIGVDIKTHDSTYLSFDDPATRAPVVWVWVASTEDTRLNALRPIGGNPVIYGSTGLSFAVSDADGIYRRYRPFEQSDSGFTASFARAIFRRVCAERKSGRSGNELPKQCDAFVPEASDELFVVGAGVSPDSTVDARLLLSAFKNRESNRADWNEMASKLSGKIVLVGSEDYHDVHRTPGGTAGGVFLQSRLVESELTSAFFRVPSDLVSNSIKLLLALVVMIAYVKVSAGAALLIVASISGAVFWYIGSPSAAGGFYVSVVPLLVGIVLDLIIESHYGHAIVSAVEKIAGRLRDTFRGIVSNGASEES